MNTKFLFASVAALVIATPAMAQDEAPEFKGGARVEARIGRRRRRGQASRARRL